MMITIIGSSVGENTIEALMIVKLVVSSIANDRCLDIENNEVSAGLQ